MSFFSSVQSGDPESDLPPLPLGDRQHRAPKLPRPILETVFAFPPNRDTLGGTAYLLCEDVGNILIDCPAWDETNQTFIQEQGSIRWLFLTHRGGRGNVQQIQHDMGCEVVVQEQEAYLLPGFPVTSFQQEFRFSQHSRAFWTPGHSPGSACLYHAHQGGVLFSGRHLLPNQQGEPVPLRIAKTFHWKRQIWSIQRLLEEFTPESLRTICPGANTGFLRGQGFIDHAYEQLSQLDLEQCAQLKPML